MATTRKTTKYYRDIFTSGSITSAITLLPEVIKKYGSKRWTTSKGNDRLYIKHYTKFEWNHRIESFYLNDKGEVCADIYWQGDSTDGNLSVYARTLVGGHTIPCESEFDGYRTYFKHSDIRISKEEFEAAIRAVGKFLAPDAIKERKIARERADKFGKVFEHIDEKKKGLDRWEMEGFWNGRIAVQKLLEDDELLIDKPLKDLIPIIDQVWENNNKSDYSLRGGYWGGEKKYNLLYVVPADR